MPWYGDYADIGIIAIKGRERGHPLKGPLSRISIPHSGKSTVFSFKVSNVSNTTALTQYRFFCRTHYFKLSVGKVTAPVTHRDQGSGRVFDCGTKRPKTISSWSNQKLGSVSLFAIANPENYWCHTVSNDLYKSRGLIPTLWWFTA